jgi:hypothetical protein
MNNFLPLVDDQPSTLFSFGKRMAGFTKAGHAKFLLPPLQPLNKNSAACLANDAAAAKRTDEQLHREPQDAN